jgi:hypothetical protein
MKLEWNEIDIGIGMELEWHQDWHQDWHQNSIKIGVRIEMGIGIESWHQDKN